MPTCSRCGAPFELRRATDRRCQLCEAAVARLIALDTARRMPRFPFAKVLSREGAAA